MTSPTWRLYSAVATEAIYLYAYREQTPDRPVRLAIHGLDATARSGLAQLRRGDVLPASLAARLREAPEVGVGLPPIDG